MRNRKTGTGSSLFGNTYLYRVDCLCLMLYPIKFVSSRFCRKSEKVNIQNFLLENTALSMRHKTVSPLSAIAV